MDTNTYSEQSSVTDVIHFYLVFPERLHVVVVDLAQLVFRLGGAFCHGNVAFVINSFRALLRALIFSSFSLLGCPGLPSGGPGRRRSRPLSRGRRSSHFLPCALFLVTIFLAFILCLRKQRIPATSCSSSAARSASTTASGPSSGQAANEAVLLRLGELVARPCGFGADGRDLCEQLGGRIGRNLDCRSAFDPKQHSWVLRGRHTHVAHRPVHQRAGCSSGPPLSRSAS